MKNFLQNVHFDFVAARKWAYCLSGAVVIFAILGLEPHIFGKLNLGIDFSGGRNYVVRFDQNINTQDVRESLDKTFSATLEDGELFSLNVITYGNDANQVRISTNYRIHEDNAEADEAIEALLYEGCKPFLSDNITFDDFRSTESNAAVGIMQSQKVGPAIADDITTSAIWAVLAALLVIFLYILLRFRNFAYSVGALTALAHDTVIVLGLYAILWKIMPQTLSETREEGQYQRRFEQHAQPYLLDLYEYIRCPPRYLHLRWRDHPGLRIRTLGRCDCRYLFVCVHRFADCI